MTHSITFILSLHLLKFPNLQQHWLMSIPKIKDESCVKITEMSMKTGNFLYNQNIIHKNGYPSEVEFNY